MVLNGSEIGAEVSVTIGARSSAYSDLLGSTRIKRRLSSVSCWMRSITARLRTAGSPSGSIGLSCCWGGPTPFGM